MAISTAVDLSAVARTLGIKVEFKDLRAGSVLFLPQRLMLIGQGASSVTYDTTKRRVTSAGEAGELYGYGSPVHLAVSQLLPTNGDGVGTIPVTVYPLEDDASGVAATGTITPTGTVTTPGVFRVSVNNILSEQFVLSVDDTVAEATAAITEAVNAVLDMPVIATDNTTDVGLAAKWTGSTGNDIRIDIIGPTDSGITFATTQPSGGLADPDVQPALDQVGNVWESMALFCGSIEDNVNLDRIQTWGEGRWGALVRKPLTSWVGNTIADRTAAIAVADSRKTDRINGQLVLPGSKDLPFVVAARQLARILPVANNNPPRDYGSLPADGLTPGTDGEQWDYIERDAAVKAGSSTIEVVDGVPQLADIVTFYHPTGEPIPGYRYLVDIVKVQNILFNYQLTFAKPEWDGAPLIPDDQPTINPSAKKPRMARAALSRVIDSLALNAILSDPEFAKANLFAQISDQNPKRLDIASTVKISGNTNIISVDLGFGFYFGQPAIVG